MATCWLTFEDGERGHEVVYWCERESGHDGEHRATVDIGSMRGTLTWEVKPGYVISRGREGEEIRGQAAAPDA